MTEDTSNKDNLNNSLSGNTIPESGSNEQGGDNISENKTEGNPVSEQNDDIGSAENSEIKDDREEKESHDGEGTEGIKKTAKGKSKSASGIKRTARKKVEKTDAKDVGTADEKKESRKKISKDSNYQVSLIDERVLKIKVTTDKSLSIDCSVKDKSAETDTASETQSNKISIHPRNVKQEVEILVSIDDDVVSVAVPQQDIPQKEVQEKPESTVTQKLIPNPAVIDLLKKSFRDEEITVDDTPKTPEEILELRLGKKNPWKIYRNLLRRNLIRGFTGALIIFVVATIVFATAARKKLNNQDAIEQKRLVVMQDLPENINQALNVQDPNKPPEEENSSEDGSEVPRISPPVTPRKITRPPRTITNVQDDKKDTNDIASTNRELDSLRKLNTVTQNTGTNDTTGVNTNLLPDSLLTMLNENEVGLIGRFPPNWKQMDSRQININQKEFTGVILVDTTVKKKEEALTMNIQLDLKGEYWSSYTFKNVFDEDSIRTIYSIDPKMEASQTYYRFYVAGKTDNVFVSAFVETPYFEKYKPEIERVVKSIRIQKGQNK